MSEIINEIGKGADEYISQVIESDLKSNWLPPLIGRIAEGRVTWQRLQSIDYDMLGCILSCHLIVEHYLDHLIVASSKAPFDWDSARLTFAQKVSLISKMFKDPYNLPPTMKHLNSLRNKFSHNVNSQLAEEDMLPFRQFVEKLLSGRPTPKDRKELLHLFTNFACAYLGGFIASSHAVKFRKGSRSVLPARKSTE